MNKTTIKLVLIDNDKDCYLQIYQLLSGIDRVKDRVKIDLNWVNSIAAAQELFDSDSPDIGLPDIYLIDYQMAHKINYPTGQTPIILLAQQEINLAAINIEADDYLIKSELNAPLLVRVIIYSIERQQLKNALVKAQQQLALAQQITKIPTSNAITMLPADRSRPTPQPTQNLAILRGDSEILQSLIQASPLAIIGLSANGDISLWNGSAERIFGWKSSEVIGRTFLITHEHKDKQDEFLHLRERILAGEEFSNMEMHYQKKDGSPIDIHISTVTTVNGTLVVIDDITKHKRIERRLTTQYAVTRILAESLTLSDAIPQILEVICKCFEWEISTFWGIDPSAKVLRCQETWHVPSLKPSDFNNLSKRITFLPGIGLPGRVWVSRAPLWITYLSKDTNFLRLPVAIREGLRSAFGFPILVMDEFFGVIESFSREIQQPDQDLLDMLVTFGSQIGQFIERKRAESALQQSEKKYRSLVANIPGVTWTSNQAGNTIFISPNIEKIYGFSPAEIYQQQRKHWFERTHPADIELVKKAYESLFTENKIFDVEYRTQKKDGRWIWIHDRALATYEKDGVIYADGLFSDITKRRRIQEALEISARQQAIVVELGQKALIGGDINLLMDEAVDTLAQILDVDFSGIWELLPNDNILLLKTGKGWQDGDVGNITLAVSPDYFTNYRLTSDKAMIIEDLRGETRFNIPSLASDTVVISGMGLPILWLGQPFGILAIFTKKRREFTKSDIHFFQTIANVTAAAIGRKWSEENRTKLLSQILLAQEKERRWIARELHDEAGQSLTSLLVGFRVIDIAQTLSEAKTQAEFLRKTAAQTLRNLKRLAQGLHPHMLEDLGLMITLDRFADDYIKSHRIAVKITAKNLGEHRLLFPIELAIYRIVQEALTNIAKHAQAHTVKITIERILTGVILIVKDDGRGFDVETTMRSAAVAKHLGLYSMCERVSLLGGIITIKSKPAKGTVISIQIPINNDNPVTEIGNI